MTYLYPHNLLLVSLAAGISMYLGFLSTKDTPRNLFIQLSFITILLWAGAAFIAGLKVGGYVLGCGLMATTAWRQFCLHREFLAKVWLSGATAFGGIFCILQFIVIPPSPPAAQFWFISSIYFGAFVLATLFMSAAIATLAYRKEAIPASFLEHALVFNLLALGLRAVLLIVMLIAFPRLFPNWGDSVVDFLTRTHLQQFLGWVGLGIVAPAGISFWAYTLLKKGAKPADLWRPLALGFLATLAGEYLARTFFF